MVDGKVVLTVRESDRAAVVVEEEDSRRGEAFRGEELAELPVERVVRVTLDWVL